MRLKDIDKILQYDKSQRVARYKKKLNPRDTFISSVWKSNTEKASSPKFIRLVLLLAITFFIISVVVAFFAQITGLDNSISPSKINIIIQGPIVAKGDESVPLVVRVVNRNPVTMQSPKLIVDYPNGSYTVDKKSRALRTEEIALDDIENNDFIEYRLNQRFLGEAGEKKDLQLTVEYRVKGSRSLYRSKKEIHTITLHGDTVSITKPSITRAVSGKEVIASFNVTSNISFPLPTLAVRVRYPSGFVPIKASIPPIDVEKTIWTFNNFPAGSTRNIQIRGIVRGEQGVEQTLAVEVFASPIVKDTNTVLVAKAGEEIVIEKSFLSAELLFNDSESKIVVVSPDKKISGVIRWRNEDSAALTNVVLIAKIIGTGLDESKVKTIDGYYDFNNNQLVWNQTNNKKFAKLDAGDFGTVSFSFNTLPARPEFSSENKFVTISISAMANRVGYEGADKITNIIEKTVKVHSSLQVSNTTLHATSRLQNIGPVPPQVNKETSYVLHYFIKNDGNILNDVVITIPLSPKVTFTKLTDGVGSQNLQYDEDIHTITVTIPRIEAFGVNASSSIEVQVSVTPQEVDVGKAILLAKKARFTARDIFVDREYAGVFPELDTFLSTEPDGYTTSAVRANEGG